MPKNAFFQNFLKQSNPLCVMFTLHFSNEFLLKLHILVAQVPRYKKVRLKYFDEQANLIEKDFDGIVAQIIQHEVDHLNGLLYVDKVKNTKSYMTFKEYKKMVLAAKRK